MRGSRMRWGTYLAVSIAASLSSAGALSAQLRYDREYPTIPYAAGKSNDAIAGFWDVMAAGRATLENVPVTGYLTSLLKALDVSLESQALVFSRTSFLKGLISSATPRAIYFNDETYLAWIPESEVVEKIMLAPVAVKRLVEPPEVAELVAFLCSPAADSVSGTSFAMDGAWTAH